jgi:hypothetical protein|tara:strand:+ start:1306 stop:1764 length:459 start_codon:yes stop_codon:yes gene_type:complete
MSEVEATPAFDLGALAALAVVNNNKAGSGGVPSFKLSIEAARDAIVCKNGNRRQVEGAPQALTLSLGRVTLDLSAVGVKNATRINVPEADVENYTGQLLAAVQAGIFDDAIKAAQFKADPANRKPVEKVVVTEDQLDPPADVDLDAIDLEEL